MLRACLRRRMHPLVETALCAFLLGGVCAVAAGLLLLSALDLVPAESYRVGLYLLGSVVFFHFSEFLVACIYRPHDASPKAFMLLHSPQFLVANAVAWVEFSLRACGVVGLSLPLPPWAVLVFCGLSIAGQAVRVVGMVQCSDNFSLMVEDVKRPEHRLVQHGLYRVLRHPAYFGWFYHVVAGQVVLGNPVCSVLFALAAWKFFKDRIPDEEGILASPEFFGAEYDRYKQRTVVGIPFL